MMIEQTTNSTTPSVSSSSSKLPAATDTVDEPFDIALPEPPNGLNVKNVHTRDQRIQFFEKDHIYDIDGRRDFVSCTTFVHRFVPEFNSELVIQKMMGNPRKWPSSPYYGMTPDEIKELWRRKGELAAHKGTLLHACIEFFYNGWSDKFPYPEPDVFKTQFKSFQERVVDSQGLEPYRTEWFVFDEEHEIAGSIDMLYRVPMTKPACGSILGGSTECTDEPETLMIYDWKRTLKLGKRTNPFESLYTPLDHIPNTSYWQYCMQLNIYRHILETKYNKKIAGMYLVAMHPDLDGFQQVKVPFLYDETKSVFDSRKKELTGMQQ